MSAVYIHTIDLNRLNGYSNSVPSGIYPGKMWGCFYGKHRTKNERWYLCWIYENEKGELFIKKGEIIFVYSHFDMEKAFLEIK